MFDAMFITKGKFYAKTAEEKFDLILKCPALLTRFTHHIKNDEQLLELIENSIDKIPTEYSFNYLKEKHFVKLDIEEQKKLIIWHPKLIKKFPKYIFTNKELLDYIKEYSIITIPFYMEKEKFNNLSNLEKLELIKKYPNILKNEYQLYDNNTIYGNLELCKLLIENDLLDAYLIGRVHQNIIKEFLKNEEFILKYPIIVYKFYLTIPLEFYENFEIVQKILETSKKYSSLNDFEKIWKFFKNLVIENQNKNLIINYFKLRNFYDLKIDEKLLKKISPSFWGNKEIAQIILKDFPYCFNNLPLNLQNNINFLYSIFIKNPQIWFYFNDEIKSDKMFINSPKLYCDFFIDKQITLKFPEEFKKDKKFFENAVNKNNYKVFDFADDKLKKDKEFLLILIKKNANILDLVDDKVKTNRFIKKAKLINPNIANNDKYKINQLKYAKELIDKKSTALNLIDKKLFQNLTFIKYLVKKFNNKLNILNKFIENINDIEIIKYLLKANPYFYKYTNNKIKDNMEIIKFACALDPENIRFTNYIIYSNHSLIKELLKENNAIIQYLPITSMRQIFKYDVADEYIYLTQNEVLEREKWNKTKIDYFLGEPDRISETSAYGKKMPVYLFNLKRIKDAEALEIFPTYRKNKTKKIKK